MEPKQKKSFNPGGILQKQAQQFTKDDYAFDITYELRSELLQNRYFKLNKLNNLRLKLNNYKLDTLIAYIFDALLNLQFDPQHFPPEFHIEFLESKMIFENYWVRLLIIDPHSEAPKSTSIENLDYERRSSYDCIFKILSMLSAIADFPSTSDIYLNPADIFYDLSFNFYLIPVELQVKKETEMKNIDNQLSVILARLVFQIATEKKFSVRIMIPSEQEIQNIKDMRIANFIRLCLKENSPQNKRELEKEMNQMYCQNIIKQIPIQKINSLC